jgi:hypothetical protein
LAGDADGGGGRPQQRWLGLAACAMHRRHGRASPRVFPPRLLGRGPEELSQHWHWTQESGRGRSERTNRRGSHKQAWIGTTAAWQYPECVRARVLGSAPRKLNRSRCPLYGSPRSADLDHRRPPEAAPPASRASTCYYTHTDAQGGRSGCCFYPATAAGAPAKWRAIVAR